eukprot:scaffold2224_cov107-Isochrysis_galbana.AAC.1
MGDARKYTEIRAARFQYAMLWLPKKLHADYELRLRQQWIDNNLTYLGAELLVVLTAVGLVCPHTRCVVCGVGLACDLKISHGQCVLALSAPFVFRRPLLLVAPTPDGGLIHVPLVSPRTGGRWERPHSDRGGAACVVCCLCMCAFLGRVAEWMEAEPHASNAGA